MLNVVQFYDCSNLSLKVGTIIGDNLLGYPILANDVILYEFSHMLVFGVGDRFHPLGEVVNCHKDVFVSIQCLRCYSSYHIFASD